jgi:hypothetical protein
MNPSTPFVYAARQRRGACFALTFVLVLGVSSVPHPGTAADPMPDAAEVEFFERKIRPVLSEHCHSCHSAAKKQKAHLLLDSRAGVLKGGDSGPVVVPGKPEESRLIRAVRYTDADLRMPPRSKLSDEQIADLVAWVGMGAPWPAPPGGNQAAVVKEFDLNERRKHWSFQPLRRTAPPPVRQIAWPRNPVDRFVLASLEANGLPPAAAADRRTLLRRVTYDLLGLPPTPAEIDAFLADAGPDAYERAVERLLASPHYGERWARHWLDLARFAETAGHEHDFELPDTYRYRDYAIRAFNDDVAYDQFVIEHVAGDVLPRPRRHPVDQSDESIQGTGFWFLGEAKHSPVDVRADEAERIDNQIDVFGKTFLGLTLACARCHDHKFDPVSTRDYYALSGYLESSRYQRAFIDSPEPTRELLRQFAAWRTRYQATVVTALAHRLRDQVKDGGGWSLRAPVAGRADSSQPGPVVFEDFHKGTYEGWYVTGDAFGTAPGRPGDFVWQLDRNPPVASVLAVPTAHSGTVSRKLQGALRSKTFTITKKKIHYRVSGDQTQINLILDGFQQIRDPIYGGLTVRLHKVAQPEWRSMDVSMWQGHKAYVEFEDDGPGWIAVDQVLFSDEGSPPQTVGRLLETPPARLSELLRELLDQWQAGRLPADPDRLVLLGRILEHAAPLDFGDLKQPLERMRQLEEQFPTPRRAVAMADGTGWDERVFIRGSHKNLGDVVPRRFLEVLAGTPQPAPAEGSGRLELARRVVDPSNPLPSRVLVNRLWQHHFGEGLVRSVDNFGVLGELPSHPELLDYLATEFMRTGWSIKHMHRLMVLSSTYRMASRSDPPREERDADNRLLHRMPIRRLEAECIRDALLALSGRLDRRMYGPGVMPHLTPFMAGRGRPNASGPLDGAGRRSIYLNVRRNFLTPLFLAFDYPIPFTTMGKRSVSNVPAQALTMLNNPFVLQQAELWAQRVLGEPGLSRSQRLERMYAAAFGRPPTAFEVAEALAFLDDQDLERGHRDDVQSWSQLGHVLWNVKDFLFIP